MPKKSRAPRKSRAAAATRTRNSSRTAKTSRASSGRRSTKSGRRSGAGRTRTSAARSRRTGTRRGAAPHRNLHTAERTTDHDTIRRWAEERGGHPAAVKRTNRGRNTGIIRIDFPGYSGEGSLEEISWDDFFRKFDDSNLALVYQEKTAEGEKSNFNKLVRRTARRRS